MGVKVSKVVTPVQRGASGGEIIEIILRAISDAQHQVKREGGVILPLCTVKILVEQEFDDGKP